MTPIYQSAPDPQRPESGGDCFRACIASLLDIRRSEVPHFYAGLEGGQPVPGHAEARMRAWFAARGLYLIGVPFEADDAAQVMEAMGARHPGLHYILCGQSFKGRDHAVVARDMGIVHDPSHTNRGLHGPQRDGCYHVFLIGALV